MKVCIVLINGLGGCGKSTFVTKCAEYANAEYNSLHTMVYELSTVDYVKRVASMVGWQGGKSAKDRVFLSDLKKAFDKWNNAPVLDVFNNINRLIKNDDTTENYIIFVNSREPKDITTIINKAKELNYQSMTIKVVKENIVVNEVPDLIEGIESIQYDEVIHNDGTLEDLYNTAKKFVNKIERIESTQYDEVVHNNGTMEDLYNTAKDFVNKIIGD